MSDLITVPSSLSVTEATAILTELIEENGLTVFARIDHGANATAAGVKLRPTVLILFGHPRGGTPLMLDRQTAGLDLPFRVLVWEDAAGQTHLSYHHPQLLMRLHGLDPRCQSVVDTIGDGVGRLVAAAAS